MTKTILVKIILSLAVPVSLAAAQPIWIAGIADDAEGPYSEAAAQSDFGPFLKYAKVPDGRARIKTDSASPASPKRVLEVLYPKGCVGPDACAMQVRAYFQARESAWMRYRVKFEDGFDWNKGGKLPGLCGGECNTGCIGVSGTDGWSARMMWHAQGSMVQYLYYPEKNTGCGADFTWDKVKLQTGRWYEIMNQIVLNTPAAAAGGEGAHDGVLRAWLDGQLVLERTDFRYRDAASVKLDEFYFSTFFGGDSPDWAPGRDSYASFSDMAVYASDPRVTSGLPQGGPGISLARDRGGQRSLSPHGPGAFLEGGILRVTSRSQGPLRLILRDAAGRRSLAFSAPGPGEYRFPADLHPGLYILGWNSPRGSGTLALTAL